MRLLNVRSKAVEEFFDGNIPPYAILSHTWGKEEVTLSEITQWYSYPIGQKLGYKKIKNSSQQALKDGLDYIWIDTCCIDKASSAELSEAINSMFRWYQGSVICYAYLDDVNEAQLFELSRWFSRGWTLQELIAPIEVKFFGSDWTSLGARSELVGRISQITGIEGRALTSRNGFLSSSIARRMSWASRRKTTRVEDQAYCLLGIFEVNMPLLYGEGDKAFTRLQEEIIKISTDHSIFAFRRLPSTSRGLLATSPGQFATSGNIYAIQGTHGTKSYTMTNLGLQMELPLYVGPNSLAPFAVLDIRNSDDPGNHLGLQMQCSGSGTQDMTFIPVGDSLATISPKEAFNARRQAIILTRGHIPASYFAQENRMDWILALPPECLSFDVSSDSMVAKGFKLTNESPDIQKKPNLKALFIFRNDSTDQVVIDVKQLQREQFKVRIRVSGPNIRIRPGTKKTGEGDLLANLSVILGEPTVKKSVITSTIITAHFEPKVIGAFTVCRLSVNLQDSMFAG